MTTVGIFSRESSRSLKDELPVSMPLRAAPTETKKGIATFSTGKSNLNAGFQKATTRRVPPIGHSDALQLRERSGASLQTMSLQGERSVKEIALTFDDGPHPHYTERLLEILHTYHVPATFFVVGKQVELHPELLQKIFREGHELANHTYSHRDLRALTYPEFESELDKTQKIVASLTDQQMKFFRPPGGQYDAQVIERGKELGYTMVLWTVFPQDHSNPSMDTIRSRVLKAARKNGIVLFHSGIQNTLSILPELIVELRKRGYAFVTVSQLVSAR